MPVRRGSRRRRWRVSRTPAIGFALAVASTLLHGCFLWTSADQGAELQRRQAALEQRVTALETGLGEEIRAEVAHAKAKVAELEDVLDRATQLLTSTSANTGAEVERLSTQVAQQEGAIAELRHELERFQEEFREQQADYENRMKKLARRAGIDMPLEDAEIPADREQHWTAIQQAYEAREFSTTRALGRAYVQRYRDDARADDAQLMIGRTYLLEDRPATSLGELRRVITDFARGDAVPAALLAMADAFYRLHACGDARTALEALIRGHPRSPLVGEARNRLRDIQRAPAGYCTS